MSKCETLKAMVIPCLVALGMICFPNYGRANQTETLTVAGGCFWCVESDFESIRGVIEAESGYTGGTTKNPTYKKVSRGGTGHYEAVRITFDPAKVSVETLLNTFFRSVDPTDSGGQFCDRGESYRTAIFYNTPQQQAAAERSKNNAATRLNTKVVTPVLPAGQFYAAEGYHQDYYKGENWVLTRFGPKRQYQAYKTYRKACGRDNRVRELWGDDAPFAKG